MTVHISSTVTLPTWVVFFLWLPWVFIVLVGMRALWKDDRWFRG